MMSVAGRYGIQVSFPHFFPQPKIMHAWVALTQGNYFLCANIIKYTIPAACNCMQTIRTKHNKHIFFFCLNTTTELEAYSSVISTFRAQGGLSDGKAKLLKELRDIFHITQERHKAEARRVANDERLCTIAEM